MVQLNEEKILEIIKLMRQGKYSKDVAKETNLSHDTCSKVWNYYSGRHNKSSLLLANKHKNTINKIKNRKNNKVEIKHYECTLFFGLIKLKFNPVY